MTHHRARPTNHRTGLRRGRLAGLLLVVTAIGAPLGLQPLASSSSPSTGAWPIDALRSERRDVRRGPAGALGEAAGAVRDGTTAFDGTLPGVANLDPALLGALRRAAARAAEDGVRLEVEGGWRSAAYQERLLDEAVATYGSEREAARWVATPGTSAHVSGDAVDIGPSGGAAWLSRHGAAHGLCQVYGNEPWHFELRPDAPVRGCPPVYPDPTHDPRMQR